MEKETDRYLAIRERERERERDGQTDRRLDRESMSLSMYYII